MSIYYIDIDGVLCTNTDGDYERAEPDFDAIAQINRLKPTGHTVVIWTARGSTTGKDWRSLTERQLDEWGVWYDELRMDKPHYDTFIDDKAYGRYSDEFYTMSGHDFPKVSSEELSADIQRLRELYEVRRGCIN